MTTPHVTLVPISRDNWKQCIELRVKPDQEGLVGANVKSLAEAFVRPESTALAIYDSDSMVGFMMYLKNIDDEYYYIHRFMVDARYQRKGIGREALNVTLEMISNRDDCGDSIRILFLTHNGQAERLYRKVGFQDSGQLIEDEKLFFYKV